MYLVDILLEFARFQIIDDIQFTENLFANIYYNGGWDNSLLESRGKMNLKKEIKTLTQLQWRWIFGIVFAIISITSIALFLLISIYVASNGGRGEALTNADIALFSESVGIYIGPFIFLSLTFFSALWLSKRVDSHPRLQGFVIGFLLGIISIILDLIFSPSVEWFEVLANLITLPAGWLGGVRGEISLKNREAVYRTSLAIRGQNKAGILNAVGEQLAGSSVPWIAFTDEDGNLDFASAWTSSSSRQFPESIPLKLSQFKSATLVKVDSLPLPIPEIHSLLILPLSNIGEKLIVASRNSVGFSKLETQNYQTIAEQVSLSLENLRLVRQARQAGIIEERQRLAAEIHDGLTQGFISIVTHLEVAEVKMEKQSADVRNDLQDLLDQVRRTARENLDAARKMTWALRPDLIKGIPLPDALENLTKEWSVTNNISVNFSYSGNRRQLHPDIEMALLRTLREALNNIQKHADATHVVTTLTYLKTLVALDIQDNGQGFNSDVISPKVGGFGLKSLQEKAEQLHGELSIESEIGKGCTIAISIPESIGEKALFNN